MEKRWKNGMLARMFWIRAGALAAALSLAVSAAVANAPAPFSRAVGGVSGPFLERPTTVVVEREAIEIDCTKDGPLHPVCTFRSVYFLHNPTAAGEEIAGAFYVVERTARYGATESRAITAEVRGASAGGTLTREQQRKLDAAVTASPGVASVLRSVREAGLRSAPFRVALGPAQRKELVFRGPFHALTFDHRGAREGYMLPAIATRHVALAPEGELSWTGSREEFFYAVTPIAAWGGNPEIEITVRHHADSDFRGSSPHAGWIPREAGNAIEERATIRAQDGIDLAFTLWYTPGAIVHGGPLVGVGPRFDERELRLRAGYEIGVGESIIGGVAAESNLDDYVTGVGTVELGLPGALAIIPSLAAGAGVLAQHRDSRSTRVGGRAQIAIAWPLVSFVFPVDYYPSADAGGGHLESGFVAQLSL